MRCANLQMGKRRTFLFIPSSVPSFCIFGWHTTTHSGAETEERHELFSIGLCFTMDIGYSSLFPFQPFSEKPRSNMAVHFSTQKQMKMTSLILSLPKPKLCNKQLQNCMLTLTENHWKHGSWNLKFACLTCSTIGKWI